MRFAQKASERPARAFLCGGIAQQPRDQVVSVRQREQLVRELGRVHLVLEVPLLLRDPDGSGERVQPVTLTGHQAIAHWTRPIIELGCGSDEDTATRHEVRFAPCEPALEKRFDPWLTTSLS